MIGSNALPATTDDKDPCNCNMQPLADPVGGWQWHKRKSTSNIQWGLNADNSVARAVNYADHQVVASGDWSQNCSFNFAMPLSASAAGKTLIALEFAPLPPDPTADKLAEIKGIFTQPDQMFRSPVAKGKYVVYVHIQYNQVTEIDTPQERFGGTVTITLKWAVTK